jgi:hypothetical protein
LTPEADLPKEEKQKEDDPKVGDALTLASARM